MKLNAILRKVANRLIEEYQKIEAEAQRKKKFLHAMEVQDRLREKAGKWDGVSEIRKWREHRK